MPCLVDGLTNATCGNHGECSSSDPSLASSRCVCDQFFDEAFNCTQTDFFILGPSIKTSSAALISIFAVLFLVMAAEIVPDFYFRHGIRALKKPFSVAKLASLFFLIALTLDMVFYLINSEPSNPEAVQLVGLYIVSHTFVIALMGVMLNLSFLSWIEIIERGRTLNSATWVKPFKISAIVLCVAVILLNALSLPLVLIPSLRHTVPQVNSAKIYLSAIFILFIMGASIFALVRSRNLWSVRTVSKVVAFKSRVFIAALVILAIYLLVSIFSLAGAPSTSKRFLTRMIFNVACIAFVLNSLLFLQSNLWNKGQAFVGYTTSYNSHSSGTSRTGTRSRDISSQRKEPAVPSPTSTIETETDTDPERSDEATSNPIEVEAHHENE